MGRRKFKRSGVVPTILKDNVKVVYTSRSPVGSFEPGTSSSPLSREDSNTSYSTKPVPASGVPITQSSAQSYRDSRASDCSWNWDCSSEEDDLDLRRICRSQEDLTTWGSSVQAWELPILQEGSNTSYNAEPVTASGVLISQSSEQAGRDSRTSDCSWNWDCSSEEDDIDLRRICRSQEDLSTWSSSEEAWVLPVYGRFPPSPSSQPCSDPRGDKLVDTEGSIPVGTPGESLSHSSCDHAQEHVSRSDLLWRGPSTYTVLCEQRDKDIDEVSGTLALLCCQPDDYTPNAALQSTNHLSPRKDSRPLDVPRRVSIAPQTPWRRQANWKPPSNPASHSSGMKLMTSPISRSTERFQEHATPRLPRRCPSFWAPATHGAPKSSPETAMAASVGSCSQEWVNDNTPDTLHRYNTKLAQRRRRLRAQRSNSTARRWSSPQMALAESTIATLPANKQWPYSLSGKDLVAVAGLVDTHCHLDFIFNKVGHRGTYAKFRLKHRETFPDCYEGCVTNFCNPASFKQYALRNDLLDEDGVWGAFGCHPHMAREYNAEVEEYLIRALDHPSVVALGEIGLDYSYKNKCDHQVQQMVFRRQLELALNRKLPLVIHSRDSTQDTIRILKEMVPEDYPMHRHCFTGGWQEAQEWLEAFPNLCLGLTPLITFEHVSRQPVTEAARNIPLDRLLLETDSPYFVPKKEARRLKHSHPGMVIHVATRLSRLRNISVEEILAVTRDNARRIYSI